MCANKKARPSHAFYFKISLLPFPANQITYAFLRLTTFVGLKFKRLLHQKKKEKKEKRTLSTSNDTRDTYYESRRAMIRLSHYD